MKNYVLLSLLSLSFGLSAMEGLPKPDFSNFDPEYVPEFYKTGGQIYEDIKQKYGKADISQNGDNLPAGYELEYEEDEGIVGYEDDEMLFEQEKN